MGQNFQGISNQPKPFTCRHPIERFRRIAAALRDGKSFTATTMARELEVSSKTVHRDLEFMRDRLGAEIEYNYLTCSWQVERGKILGALV